MHRSGLGTRGTVSIWLVSEEFLYDGVTVFLNPSPPFLRGLGADRAGYRALRVTRLLIGPDLECLVWTRGCPGERCSAGMSVMSFSLFTLFASSKPPPSPLMEGCRSHQTYFLLLPLPSTVTRVIFFKCKIR